MKIAKTIISIVFLVGTVAVIVYDGRTGKGRALSKKQDSVKIDSARNQQVKK